MRLIYSNTDKPVQCGDIVHLQNRPYYISSIWDNEESLVIISMDERKVTREIPAWKIRAHLA